MEELVGVVDSMLRYCEGHDHETYQHGAVAVQGYWERSAALLAEITTLVLTTHDDTESESALLVGDATEGIRQSCAQIAQTTGRALETVKAALDVRANCNQLHAMVKGALMSTDRAEVRYRQSEMLDLLELTRQELTLLPENETTSRISEVLTGMESLVGALFAAKERMLRAEGGLADARAGIRGQMAEMDRAVLALAEGTRSAAERQLRAGREVVSRWQGIELLLVLIALGLSVVFGVVTSISVARQIQALNAGIRIVGAGNWDHRVDTGAEDEIGQLSRAFDRMTESLCVKRGGPQAERGARAHGDRRQPGGHAHHQPGGGDYDLQSGGGGDVRASRRGEMIGRSFRLSVAPGPAATVQSARRLQRLLATVHVPEQGDR